MTRVRASVRTSFYPCGALSFGTKCNIRAKCAGKPQLSTRPFLVDGHSRVTRGCFGRVDL
jgi:hypothetical protein